MNRPHLWFLHAKQRLLDRNNKSLWVPDFTCDFLFAKTACLTSELLVSMGPSPHLWFWMQNSDLWTGITSLYGSQTWPSVLCMYDSVISTRITRLYGFQPSSVVLSIQNSNLMTAIACVYGYQTSPVVFYMENSVASIRITSACGSKTPPHLWFQHAKQRILDQNNKSLRVPDMTFRFVHVRQRD